MSKQRVWELDALRGLCVLGMVIVHLVYDLTSLFELIAWTYSPLFAFVMDWGGVLFVLISGICATLGRNSLKRGLLVFCCGLLCTAVTFGMYLLGFTPDIIIYFGVLHCLGVCMVLWQLFRNQSAPWLAALGAAVAAVGLWLRRVSVPFPWLIPLGFVTPTFASSDYFPLLPYLGFFLLGAAVGRTAYSQQVSLLPGIDPERLPFRFLRCCGRHSLYIYLLHQPVITGLLWVLGLLFR